MKRTRPQAGGSIVERNGSWHLRFYVDGVQRSRFLAHKDEQYRSRTDVVPLAEQVFAGINVNANRAKLDTSALDFVEKSFLPWVKENRQPATYAGYDKLWRKHLRAHLLGYKLYEYATSDAFVFLEQLSRRGLGRRSVAHIKSLLSSIFSRAVNTGVLKSNPVKAIDLRNIKTRPPAATTHYTPQQMVVALQALSNEPQAQIALLLAFLGLRTAEIAAVRWEDVREDGIHVQRSFWRGNIAVGGKTERAQRLVPLGDNARALLANFWQQQGRAAEGWVLANSLGNPLDLGALAARVIRPAIEARGVAWLGYYAGRRGASTAAAHIAKGDSQLTAPLFGHTKAIADLHYIKGVPEATRVVAMSYDALLALPASTGENVAKARDEQGTEKATNAEND